MNGRDIGWVADDEVVALAGQGLVHIRAQQADAIPNAVPLGVAARDLQCPGGDIRGIDLGLRKGEGAGDRDAAAAGSDVEDAAGILEPRGEARFDELGDRRSRHQHALVDIELEPRKPTTRRGHRRRACGYGCARGRAPAHAILLPSSAAGRAPRPGHRRARPGRGRRGRPPPHGRSSYRGHRRARRPRSGPRPTGPDRGGSRPYRA